MITYTTSIALTSWNLTASMCNAEPLYYYLYDLRSSDILELDSLHVLEGEAELLPVGEAGLELDEVQGDNARISKQQEIL